MNYKCKACNWIGSEEELDFDGVDTCGGDDKIEVCPKCGSYEVFPVSNSQSSVSST